MTNRIKKNTYTNSITNTKIDKGSKTQNKTKTQSEIETLEDSYKIQTKKSNYEINCKNEQLISNKYLHAMCDGEEYSLDLNKCLMNNNGILRHGKNGLFSKTCSACKINYPFWNNKIQPYNLECECYGKDLKEIKTNINFNDFIEFDKRLKCKDFDENKKYLESFKPKAIDTNCIFGKITEEYRFFSVCDNKNIINFDYGKCIFINNGVFENPSGNENENTLELNFLKSCYNCNLRKIKETQFLQCDCLDASKSIRTESRPINEFLNYENDDVKCLYDDKDKKVNNSDSEKSEIINLVKKQIQK
jgi:hypothetical protein